MTRIEFELGRDIDDALDDVRDAVDQARSDLPADIEEPVVASVNLHRRDAADLRGRRARRWTRRR